MKIKKHFHCKNIYGMAKSSTKKIFKLANQFSFLMQVQS